MGVGSGRTAFHNLTFHTSRSGSTVNTSVHATVVYNPPAGDSSYVATLKRYDTRTGSWYTHGSRSGSFPGSLNGQDHESFTGVSIRTYERLYVDFDYYGRGPQQARNHIGRVRVSV